MRFVLLPDLPHRAARFLMTQHIWQYRLCTVDDFFCPAYFEAVNMVRQFLAPYVRVMCFEQRYAMFHFLGN